MVSLGLIFGNMNRYRVENPAHWDRHSTFEFFKTFDVPFFNVTANVDVTALKAYCKRHNYSFLLASLYLSQKTLNQIPAFNYRFANNEVRLYQGSRAGCTILLPNESFAFCYFSPLPVMNDFIEEGEKAIENLKKDPNFAPRDGEANMVYYSVLPWVSFTSFQHARRHEKEDSVPRIVFGKYFKQGESIQMPLSIEAHHSFVDGIHVGKYFEILQKEINQLKIE